MTVIFKDMLTGDELFSNSYKVEVIDGCLQQVECHYVTREVGGGEEEILDLVVEYEDEREGLRRCEMTGENYMVEMNGYLDELKRKWSQDNFDDDTVAKFTDDFRLALEQLGPKLATAHFYACPDVYPKLMRPGLIGVFEEQENSDGDSDGGFMYFPKVAIMVERKN